MKGKSLAAAVLTLSVATVSAHGPTRQKVTEKITVQAPVEEVWRKVEDFCSIATWHPRVERCEREGNRRTLVLKGGYKVVDELRKFQPKKFMYKYKTKHIDPVERIEWQSETVEVPVIPVANFSSVFQLKRISDHTTEVTWKGAFYRAYLKNDPPAKMSEDVARNSVREFFQEGLQGLKVYVEGQ